VPRAKGILWPAEGQQVYDVGREESVPAPVSLVVRHLWNVRWRRPADQPFASSVVSNPIAHLTFEDAVGGRLHGHEVPAPLVHGLVSRVFSVELPVAGRVTGVAFHPGGLTALLGVGMRELADTVVPATRVFGDGVGEVARAVLAEPDEGARREIVLSYLGELLGPQQDRVAGDPAYSVVRAAEDLMRQRDQVSLPGVAEQVSVSPRTLQRMFSQYVGASPLWVLRRYRLQDAASLIDAGEGENLADLAASLGFADQAHFTRAFTAVIGVPPSGYRAGVRPGEDGTRRADATVETASRSATAAPAPPSQS